MSESIGFLLVIKSQKSSFAFSIVPLSPYFPYAYKTTFRIKTSSTDSPSFLSHPTFCTMSVKRLRAYALYASSPFVLATRLKTDEILPDKLAQTANDVSFLYDCARERAWVVDKMPASAPSKTSRRIAILSVLESVFSSIAGRTAWYKFS